MNIFLYIIIFIMGTVFGSFYTLAVYRIPRKLDITHTHSFCPNCNHRLGFFELIPVWSYIFLGGKCKECKQKIRPRYLILEILSGLVFVLIAIGAKLDVANLQIKQLIDLLFLVLYLTAIFLIAGIDKEKRGIERSVIYYAFGVLVTYIVYLCIIEPTSIYRYVMYLIILLILLIIDTYKLKKEAKTDYTISILMLIMIMAVFTGEYTTILTIIMTLLVIAILIILNKIKKSKQKVKIENKDMAGNLSLGFYLCISNVVMLIFTIFLINRWKWKEFLWI